MPITISAFSYLCVRHAEMARECQPVKYSEDVGHKRCTAARCKNKAAGHYELRVPIKDVKQEVLSIGGAKCPCGSSMQFFTTRAMDEWCEEHALCDGNFVAALSE